MKRSRANTAVDSQQGGRIPWFQVIVNSVIGFGSSRLDFHRLVPPADSCSSAGGASNWWSFNHRIV